VDDEAGDQLLRHELPIARDAALVACHAVEPPSGVVGCIGT
jgi:hypothetical protein